MPRLAMKKKASKHGQRPRLFFAPPWPSSGGLPELLSASSSAESTPDAGISSPHRSSPCTSGIGLNWQRRAS
jgi:hypothetical protein